MNELIRSTPARLTLSAAMVAFTASSAFAQAPAPAPAEKAAAAKEAAPPKLPNSEWLKLCGKDEDNHVEMCRVINYIFDNQNNTIGQISIADYTREKEDKTKETKRMIEALIPPRFLIPPGVQVVIDDAKAATPGRYRICFSNGCMTEVLVTDEMMANLRKGNVLKIFFANPKGEWLGARVPLAGFSAAYDGKAMDPQVAEQKRKEFEDSQNKLQSELAKRAEEQRKKLQEQGAAAAPQAKTQ